jgi:hypothetical protein
MATREERPRSASTRGRVWLWVRRVLVALVGLIVLLLLVGLLYQFVATRIAYWNYPAPGKMLSVSGHDMQFYCTGKARGGADRGDGLRPGGRPARLADGAA